jgi:hypothetical protein
MSHSAMGLPGESNSDPWPGMQEVDGAGVRRKDVPRAGVTEIEGSRVGFWLFGRRRVVNNGVPVELPAERVGKTAEV